MGKKKEKDKDKKKKEKKDKKKKDKKKKEKKKKDKKQKKKASSSSSDDSSEGSNSSESAPVAKKQKKEKVEKEVVEEAPIIPAEGPKINLDNLPPTEDGIQRFIFTESEAGPLGLRFSGGFPPLVLSIVPNSFAATKKVPINFSVHAINGHPMLPQNHELVMSGLKTRPVALDVRPQGWKPAEKVKELQRIRERQEAEKQVIKEREEQRRREVAQETAERKQREDAERAVREEEERKERAVFEARAREKVADMRARRQEFEQGMQEDSDDLRKISDEVMQAGYGASIKIEGRRGLPLRLFTRRKDVAWNWYGEFQELIGGGVQGEPGDTFN